MKHVLFLMLNLLFSTFLCGQWTPQVSGTPDDLTEIKFVNDSVGFIVGNNGTVLKTTDGGQYWQLLNAGTTENLSALWLTNAQTGFIGGTEGSLLRTVDGGTTWQEMELPAQQIWDIRFLNGQTGFIATNDAILKTVDGGANWNEATLQSSVPTNRVYEIDFASESIGYALSNGILKTIDGGENWEQIVDGSHPDYNPANILVACEMTSVDTGYFGSPYYWGLYTTVDGAQNLSFSGRFIQAIDFPRPDTGYAVAGLAKDRLIKTTDAGMTWTETYQHPDGIPLSDVAFTDARRGWAVGGDGLILHTENGGDLAASLFSGRETPSVRVRVFPNPAQSVLRVELAGGEREKITRLELFDDSGRLALIRRPRSARLEISLPELPAGNYLLSLWTDQGRRALEKVVILDR